MMAVPAEMAFTVPDEFTVATSVLDDDHVTALLAAMGGYISYGFEVTDPTVTVLAVASIIVTDATFTLTKSNDTYPSEVKDVLILAQPLLVYPVTVMLSFGARVPRMVPVTGAFLTLRADQLSTPVTVAVAVGFSVLTDVDDAAVTV